MRHQYFAATLCFLENRLEKINNCCTKSDLLRFLAECHLEEEKKNLKLMKLDIQLEKKTTIATITNLLGINN